MKLAGMFVTAFSLAACAVAPEDVDDVSADTTDEPILAGKVEVTQNQYGVTFTNGAGAWVVYTDCYGPKKRNGQDLTVGPGYIARLTLVRPTPDGKRTIVDDERPLKGDGTPQTAGTLSSPGHGGLGAFGWHHARGVAPFAFTGNNAWEITGRHCAEDNGGFGVTSAKIVTPPSVDGAGVGHLTVDVFFSDAYTYPAPLLRVRYKYEVRPSVIDMWALVTEHCAGGVCGAKPPGPAYISEPKFLSAVVGGGYSRMAMFDGKNAVAMNSSSTNKACIMWNRVNPVVGTAQCDADGRVRARFDYGNDQSGANGGCDDQTHLCLNTVMRAYAHVANDDVIPGLPSTTWENGTVGLDAWAVRSAAREAVSPNDSANGGGNAQPWTCKGGSPAAAAERRWEMAAWGKPGQLTAAGFGFHAWEGGTGAYDCEPLTRRFGPDGESFAVHAQYAVNGGWTVK